MNAYDEDINDGDIDFWFDIKVLADGTIEDNTAPPKTTLPKPLTGGTTNRINPNFSWTQDADADTGDKVGHGWLNYHKLRISIDISKQSGWRVNRSTWNWVCHLTCTNQHTTGVYRLAIEGQLCATGYMVC